MQKLIEQAEGIRDADGIMNLKFQLSKLTIFAYGTVYKKVYRIGSTSGTSTASAPSLDEIPEI